MKGIIYENKLKFNIDSQEFSLLKTYQLFREHEKHSLSLCLNNVKIFYKEWNIEL